MWGPKRHFIVQINKKNTQIYRNIKRNHAKKATHSKQIMQKDKDFTIYQILQGPSTKISPSLK